MRRKKLKFTGLRALAVLTFGVGICAAATDLWGAPISTQEIVDQFYPVRLASTQDYPWWTPDDRLSSFVVVEQFPDGNPKTIVAGYTNSVDGAVLVIQAQLDGEYNVVSEPTGLDLGGVGVTVEPLVIDQSGLPTVEVSFSSFRANTGDWIFRWDGSKLVNLTPTKSDEDGTKYTLLVLATYVDLDHDGLLEAISQHNYPPPVVDTGELPDAEASVYKLTPNGYVLDRPLLSFNEFFRKTSAPVTETYEFSLLKNSVGPYVLKITNGERDGSNRLSSGQIVLNGVVVVTANMLNQGAEFLSVPVSLQPHNTLLVTLAAKPKGHIAIVVEDTGAPPPATPPAPPPPQP